MTDEVPPVRLELASGVGWFIYGPRGLLGGPFESLWEAKRVAERSASVASWVRMANGRYRAVLRG